MRSLLAAVVLLLLALVAAPPAGAAFRQFQSPSRNIGCEMTRAFARCDIAERDWRPPPKPARCDLDWGQGLTVGRRGRGRVVCAGDTALGAGPVLRYGRSIRVGGMRCTSRRAGMRCTSRRHHGFVLSRQTYRLF
jgi:hypothetical protein